MKGDVSSLVTLFGELSGTCVISFPRKLAVSLIGKMMMDDSLDDMTDEVQDGIGELSNLVGGGAKGRLATILGTKASLSTPAIVTGVGHTIEHKKGLPCIGCVFEADGQRFFLEIAVYIDKGVKPNPL
jgi:CheY-specific phosphatase CheX